MGLSLINNASTKANQQADAASLPISSWTSDSLSFLYEKSKAEHRTIPPLPPAEVAELIQKGEFERAVHGLGFILREGHVQILWTRTFPDEPLPTNAILDRIVHTPNLLRLTEPQTIVARMMHAAMSDGLHSSWHPSAKVFALLKPFFAQLAHEDPIDSHTPDSISDRVRGAASLIAAEASLRESTQPGGKAVLRAARHHGVPAVLFAAHHAYGGNAVPLVTEYCARNGTLNGNIWCPEFGYRASNADTIWGFEKDSHSWTKCFDRIAERKPNSKGTIIVAEPHAETQAIRNLVQVSFQESTLRAGCDLVIATDAAHAIRDLQRENITGVVTDLLMPLRSDSHTKSFGDHMVQDILEPWIPKADTQELLRKAREIEINTRDTLQKLFERLLALP